MDESANSKEKSLADYYNSFSPFIVYADESGTPTMDNKMIKIIQFLFWRFAFLISVFILKNWCL
ncbi:hypothetical protein [Snodgrassella sp. ESL0253]|uniref:hypothetical protein n=1 Tax=Snodgrassella sp. ESL0253 TaxID=2705031 RepID=UPI0019348549|nr:hypothetical protein [Snodgrassella sp. ESL0253]